MAKHKAPTQITIASIQQQSLFNELVDRYWKLAAGLAVVISIAILVPTYMQKQARVQHHSVWEDLGSQANLSTGFFSQAMGAPVESMALFADQHKDSAVGGWAKALEVGGHLEANDLDAAAKAADQLATIWPDHILSKAKLYAAANGETKTTLSDAIRSEEAAIDAWEKDHAFLFSNPELPADAPRVRFNTTKGPIVVGLYLDRAPVHAENFLKLAREGYYTGTKFHRVVRGKLIQGGDPNTIAGEPETWGLGGPEQKLDLELDPKLRHFKGSLVAWKAPGEAKSHGSQFLLMTSDQNEDDGKTVVFGKVLEGESTIEAIESGAVVEDRPQDPAVVESVMVL